MEECEESSSRKRELPGEKPRRKMHRAGEEEVKEEAEEESGGKKRDRFGGFCNPGCQHHQVSEQKPEQRDGAV